MAKAKDSKSKAKADAVKVSAIDEKQKALTEAISRMEKSYGEGIVMKLGEKSSMHV